MRLGCHLSVAGGLHNALLLAQSYTLDSVALFVRNQRQWKAAPLRPDDIETFKQTRRQTSIGPIVAHGSYLVNLAGAPDVLEKSLAACADELDRCCRLGIEYLVIHPGSSPDAPRGIQQIADSLNQIMSTVPAAGGTPTKILLESTAGQGSCLGRSFEQLADMLSRLAPADRFGLCIDTCHIFADGYDFRSADQYAAMMDQLDRLVGLRRLFALHLNDSVKDLGSHVDRHAHIGQGKIGLAAFAHFVRDPRLADLPMILETPHGQNAAGQDLDTVNIAALRGLL